MDARTAAIAADAVAFAKDTRSNCASCSTSTLPKLPPTRALERHARKLQRLHAKINAEATAIAGADFADHHTLGFDEYESIVAQQTDHEGGCSVEGAGIVDVIDMANTMANRADRVAACRALVWELL